jgi:colanic acid/amylovoran biosynthesis glycosyltransferase
VPSTSELPGLLIYAPHLLPMGQMYVREHAVRMERYKPVLAGRRRVEGISIEGIPSFTIDDGGFSALRELRYMLTGNNAGLADFIAGHRVRIIHAHFGPGAAEIMPLAAQLNIPLVVTFHGWDLKIRDERKKLASGYERLYRWRLPRLLRQASEIVCVSRNWHERILTFGCSPEKVRTNYLGIDSEFFDGNRGQFDPLSIIYVGRLIRRKGVHTLLKAIEVLRDRGVRTKLTIVGDGPEADKLKAFSLQSLLRFANSCARRRCSAHPAQPQRERWPRLSDWFCWKLRLWEYRSSEPAMEEFLRHLKMARLVFSSTRNRRPDSLMLC